MDSQFFFFEITYGCNINREQEQIFMFKLYLKFPGTAEKQSQRQRPEVAEAPLRLLWGRRLSAAYKPATSKRGRHSCQEYTFQPLGCFQHLICILKSCTHEQNPQNFSDKTGGRAVTPLLDCRAEEERAQGEPVPSSTSPKPPRVTPAAPKKQSYKSQPASRGQPAPRAYS